MEMQFIRAVIGNSASVHDVKFYAETKAPRIPAVLFGDSEKAYCRLTGSGYWNRYYAYFPSPKAPAGKVGYIELTFDEFSDLSTKKAILEIVEVDKPANYDKRLKYPATRISFVEISASTETEPESGTNPDPEAPEETPSAETPEAESGETPIAETPETPEETPEPEAKAPSRRERRRNRA